LIDIGINQNLSVTKNTASAVFFIAKPTGAKGACHPERSRKDPGLATISFSFFMKEGVPGMSFANAGGGSCENFILSNFLMTTKPCNQWCFVCPNTAPNSIPAEKSKAFFGNKQKPPQQVPLYGGVPAGRGGIPPQRASATGEDGQRS